jgi:formylglycine-generating enzyme required for sulfatase activity
MSCLEKVRTFVKRCGSPAKFVAKSIIGVAVPGSAPVMELIDKLIDCAHDTAKDNLDDFASREDLVRVEKMFDRMLDDMQDVVEHLRRLEDVPDLARKTLYAALRSEEHCLAAAEGIAEQAVQLSTVRADLAKLSAGQDDLRDLQRRNLGTLLDYIEEQREHNVAPSQLNDRLKQIEQALVASRRGEHDRAEAVFVQMSAAQPESATLAVAEAAAQAAAHQFARAANTLVRAARLRPGDAGLGEMSRIATSLSRGATPVDPRPDGGKRPQPGDTLDGWTLEKLLGFGGWGQVFLARKGEHTRALKIMHAELSRDPSFVNRFKREMSLLIALGEHPHLVPIDPEHLYGWAAEWNCWYYVMEYIEGASLQRYLDHHGALNVGQARTLFTGIAEGLAEAHRRGIVHRDIKPANILLRKDPQPGQGRGVLVDFGLAGAADAQTRGSGYTALFAAPEQMRHGTSDCRSDVYSLAATIYHCLLYGDAEKRGRFKAKFLPEDCPADVRGLLERCLDSDPDERPTHAGEFLGEWSKPKTATIVAPPSKIVAPVKPALPREFTNSIGMKFALIPAGKFLMGSPDGEQGRSADEGPQHEVEITRPFYMAVTPVTQEQYERVMGSNPSYFSVKGDGKHKVRRMDTQEFPVETVSWEEAVEFARRLSALTEEVKSGRSYRLPSEAQWEYSSRGGAPSYQVFHFGNSLSPTQANFDGNYPYGGAAKGPYLERTCKVSSYPANGFGLYDMHGNVWEWCADWYDENYYAASPGQDPLGPASASARVLRGGSWSSIGRLCRSAYRRRPAPGYRDQYYGFRLAAVPSLEQSK